jgi:recombination protein RecA
MPGEDTLTKILNQMKKNLKDKNVATTIHRADDLNIASYTPYTIPSGLAELDYQLGGKGGLPAGRLIEYYGFEMCGKTTASLHALAEVQRAGGFGAFVDAEHTFSPGRAIQCGVNLDKLHIMSAMSIESIFEAVCTYIDFVEEAGLAKKVPCLIVVDSITGTHVESEFKDKKKEYAKDQRVGAEAKAIRRGVKRLHGMLARTKVSCILINHAIATNIGVAFGKKSGSAGGHGAKIMASVRVEFKNAGKLTHKEHNEDIRDGQKISLTIEKLKNANLQHPVVKEIHLKEDGFDQHLSLLNAAIMTGWVTKHGQTSGQHYRIPFGEDERQFKGDEWESVVSEMGGYRKVYDLWVERAKNSGHIQKWEDAW